MWSIFKKKCSCFHLALRDTKTKLCHFYITSPAAILKEYLWTATEGNDSTNCWSDLYRHRLHNTYSSAFCQFSSSRDYIIIWGTQSHLLTHSAFRLHLRDHHYVTRSDHTLRKIQHLHLCNVFWKLHKNRSSMRLQTHSSSTDMPL